MSNITKVAKQLAEANPKLNKAYKYDLVMREFDNKVELIGLVDDPTYDISFAEGVIKENEKDGH